MQIDKAPDTVTTRCIYKKAQVVEDNTYTYIMAAAELDATDANIQLKKKPGPNHPEEAEEFVKQINKFMETIHSSKPYKIEDTYTDFVTRYYDLLCEVEDYFKNASIQGVLDIVDDTMCKMLRMETEHDKQDQKLCKDPRVSSGNILTRHQALNKLEVLPNFKKFENDQEFAITELFRCLQHAHNAAAETTGHLAFLNCTLSTDQFSFILKHSVCPLVQLQIPPCLCHPRELHFAKADLIPEEVFEQKAIKRVLPHPHHPQLDNVDNKHPTRCLATAVHYTLHKKLLTNLASHSPMLWTYFAWKEKGFSH